MKRILLFVSLLAGSMYSIAQIKTQPLNNAIDPAAGLVYTLPKTVVVVEVETRKILESPGLYFPYAERYLGLNNVCKTEAIRYEIVGVRLSTKAIPDLQNAYLIQNVKAKDKVAIELTPEGFLKSIGKFNAIKSIVPKPEVGATKPIRTDNYQSQENSIVTQEMQQASSTAKMAELAATQLFNLRETRINLLTMDLDKNPSDGRSYEIILSELNRMEKYYRELFTGKQVETTEKTTFEFDPQKNGEEILFRFSQLKGILDKTNLGGDPIFISLQKTVGTMADVAKSPANDGKKGYSIYYRIPGEAQFKVSDGKNIFSSENISIAQFGRVMNLPFGFVHEAQLCPKTGALLKVE